MSLLSGSTSVGTDAAISLFLVGNAVPPFLRDLLDDFMQLFIGKSDSIPFESDEEYMKMIELKIILKK
jgi:hypothetical protein